MILLLSGSITGELSLFEAEQKAKEQNMQFLLSEESVKRAKLEQEKQFSRFFPTLSYESEFQASQQKKFYPNEFDTTRTFPSSHQGYRSSFLVSQSLVDTDQIFGYKQKTEENRAEQMWQKADLSTLLYTLRVQYYRVIALKESLETAQETLDFLTYALEQEERKHKIGNSTPFEVDQNKVALSNATAGYYETLKDLKNARLDLLFTLGEDPSHEPDLVLQEKQLPLERIPLIQEKLKLVKQSRRLPTPTPLFSEKERADYFTIAHKERGDVQARKFEENSSREGIRRSQGKYLPTLSSYVRYGYNDDTLGPNSYSNQPYNWVGGLTLRWDLFDSLYREKSVEKARSYHQSTKIISLQTKQRMALQIYNALNYFEEMLFAFLSAEEGASTALLGKTQAKEQLRIGKIAPLEYRNAIDLLQKALNLKTRSSFSLLEAYYGLDYALGFIEQSPALCPSCQKPLAQCEELLKKTKTR